MSADEALRRRLYRIGEAVEKSLALLEGDKSTRSAIAAMLRRALDEDAEIAKAAIASGR